MQNATITPPTEDRDKRSFVYAGHSFTLRRRGRSWYPDFRIRHHRPRMSLNTGEFTVAVSRAREIIDDVLADRWLAVEARKTRRESATLAEVLTVYRQQIHIEPRSLAGNEWALLHLFAVVRGGPVEPGAIRLTAIDGSLILKFQSAMVARALASLPPDAPEWEQRRTREDTLASSRSIVNQARCVFTSNRVDLGVVYRAAGLELPECIREFLKLKLQGRRHRARREDEVTAPEVVAAVLDAAVELASDPPAACMFWLAVGAGLRLGEIGQVEWQQFEERDGWRWISVFGKNGDTERVPVQPRAWQALAPFARPAGRVLGEQSAEWAARRVNGWMRSKGWLGPKVLHDLRAVVLSRALEQDPRAAQAMARHHELKTLLMHYAHHAGRRPVTVL